MARSYLATVCFLFRLDMMEPGDELWMRIHALMIAILSIDIMGNNIIDRVFAGSLQCLACITVVMRQSVLGDIFTQVSKRHISDDIIAFRDVEYLAHLLLCWEFAYSTGSQPEFRGLEQEVLDCSTGTLDVVLVLIEVLGDIVAIQDKYSERSLHDQVMAVRHGNAVERAKGLFDLVGVYCYEPPSLFVPCGRGKYRSPDQAVHRFF